MSLPPEHRSTSGAFTLVELIVTLGVAAILCTLLFTGHSYLSQQGKISGDVNNLRQIGVAAHLYMGEHRYHLPPVIAPGTPGINGPTYVHDLLIRQMGISADLRSTQPDRKALALWLSPGDERKPPFLSPLRSYAVNYFAGDIYTIKDSTTAHRYAEVKNPSAKLYFLPGEGEVAEPTAQARFSPLTRPIGGDHAGGTLGVRFYSSGETPALWLDGHVSLISKTELQQNPQALIYPKLAPPGSR